MKAPEFSQLRSRRMRLPIPFNVFDPATGVGSRMKILVDVQIAEDRQGLSIPDGHYTGVGRGRDRTVVYHRVGDVRFAPFCDVCNQTPDMIRNGGPTAQMESLRTYDHYAMPKRFADVFRLDEQTLHPVTKRIPVPHLHEKPRLYEDVVAKGQIVIGWDERLDAIREAASRSFLLRRDVGLCIAATPPVWGVFESGGHAFLQLHMIAPGRGRVDVFDIRRREAAVEYARQVWGSEPRATGAVVELTQDLPPEDDALDAFACMREVFHRLLRGSVCDLDAEGVRFWHDCAGGSVELDGYGSAREMLDLLDRVGGSLSGKDGHDRWMEVTIPLRRRLAFEAERSPAPEPTHGSRP